MENNQEEKHVETAPLEEKGEDSISQEETKEELEESKEESQPEESKDESKDEPESQPEESKEETEESKDESKEESKDETEESKDEPESQPEEQKEESQPEESKEEPKDDSQESKDEPKDDSQEGASPAPKEESKEESEKDSPKETSDDSEGDIPVTVPETKESPPAEDLKPSTPWTSSDYAHRHPSIKKGDPLASAFIEGCDTLGECFEHACKNMPETECLGYRPVIRYHKADVNLDGKVKTWNLPELGHIRYLKYKEVHKIVHNFSSGLVGKTRLKRGENFGIYCNTRKEWLMSAQACFLRGIVVATCYANLGVEALVHVINQCELTAMVVTPDNFKILESVQDQIPTLKTLIYVDDKKDFKSDRFTLIKWEEVADFGAKNPVPMPQEKIDAMDTAVIMYTSGSTGLPKGVMVTHKNVLSAAAGVFALIKPTEDDYYIGYLPLAHILELAVENGLFFMGIRIGYGSPRTLIELGVRNCKGDILEIAPTIMVGVPRVWDTIKKGARAKLNQQSSIKKWLFNAAYTAQQKRVTKNKRPSKFWNYLVFEKLQKRLGGRMRILVSGGAPLSEETHEFLKVLFNNSSVIQGYGLTETTSSLTMQDFTKYTPGNVGHPQACCEVKLVDVPDMGYLTSDKPYPRGEVLVSGANVAKGYYKNPKKTSEVFIVDEHGQRWFRTGDIGAWLPNGELKLVDRKKNLVKLSGGEYVSLETLEMLAGNSNYVAPNGICVVADPLKSAPIALVCMNSRYLDGWKPTSAFKNLSDTAMYKDAAFVKLVHASLNEQLVKNKRPKMEHLKKIWIVPEPFSVEEGTLTAAMKLQRQVVAKKYGEHVKRMFDSFE